MFTLTLFVVVSTSLQEAPHGTRSYRGAQTRRPSEWKADWGAGARLKFDDNVFRFDGGQEDRLEADRASDKTSGRFDDMESVEDFVLTPTLEFRIDGPSPFGRSLEFQVDLDYDQYVLNAARSHLDLELGVEQQAGPNGRIGLSFGVVPEYFSKNYLADAVDPASDGVSSSERRYEPGTYLKWDAELAYRHRILDRDRSQAVGLYGILSVGYAARSYDSPFDGRDRDARFARLELRFAYDPKGAAGRSLEASGFRALKWGFRYRVDDARSSSGSEVLLLDEPDFGLDLNGDGDATDNNARTVQTVDRSYVSHRIGLFFEVEFAAGVDLGAGYARRFRSYSSDEVFDVAHRDREDTRDEIRLYARFDLSEGWESRLGYGRWAQDTDRAADPDRTGEVLDYTRNVFYLAVEYSW